MNPAQVGDRAVGRAAFRACGGMNKREWLAAQNTRRHELRRARGVPERVRRDGLGTILAQQRWNHRRALARRAKRRRLEVVGRVRLRGKGPPPRAGPLPAPRRHFVDDGAALAGLAPSTSSQHGAPDARPHDEIATEPLDSPMFELIDSVRASEGRSHERAKFKLLAQLSGVPPVPPSWCR